MAAYDCGFMCLVGGRRGFIAGFEQAIVLEEDLEARTAGKMALQVFPVS